MRKKINCRFVIETHLKILDSELLTLLKECGLVGVKVGVENFDTELLKKEGRFTVSRDDQLEKIKEIKLRILQYLQCILSVFHLIPRIV